jgi:hypothetical protein
LTSDWVELQENLDEAISEITGIETKYLAGTTNSEEVWPLGRASVSKRMSWAANRSTTRIEDLAYCLIGIFDINMPLLYGEGSKAFLRLQEEIIKVSNDHTILCWEWSSDENVVPRRWNKVLAPCPSAFRNSGRFVPLYPDYRAELSYSLTNAGLLIKLSAVQTCRGQLAVLDVSIADGDHDPRTPHESFRRVCLPLRGGAVLSRSHFPPAPFPLDALVWRDAQELYLKLRDGGTEDDAETLAWPQCLDTDHDVGFYVVVFGGELTSMTVTGGSATKTNQLAYNVILFNKMHPQARRNGYDYHMAEVNITVFSGLLVRVLLAVQRRFGHRTAWALDILRDNDEVNIERIFNPARSRSLWVTSEFVDAMIGKEIEFLEDKLVRPVYIMAGEERIGEIIPAYILASMGVGYLPSRLSPD